MLAGAIHQIERDTPPEEWLRWGVAVGTAATQCAAGELASPASIRGMVQRLNVRVES